LEEVVRALSRSDDPAVVVTSEQGHAIGWITHRNALRTYHHGRERLTPDEPRAALPDPVV
jgi:hypothetical protein